MVGADTHHFSQLAHRNRTVQVIVDIMKHLTHPDMLVQAEVSGRPLCFHKAGKQLEQDALAFEFRPQLAQALSAVRVKQFRPVVIESRIGIRKGTVRIQLQKAPHQAVVQLPGPRPVPEAAAFKKALLTDEAVQETDVVVAHLFLTGIGMVGEFRDQEEIPLRQPVFFPVHIDPGFPPVHQIHSGERTDHVLVTPFSSGPVIAGINHLQGQGVLKIGVSHQFLLCLFRQR